ncbi:MAG TPA: hypothetical protein P5511_05670 [Candidatus Goldiibacteriota bacterium]|nr:hypothetical protein [Candidatus Goldiibacteriota bacterium]
MKRILALATAMVFVFSMQSFAAKKAEKEVKKAATSVEKAVKGEGVVWTDVNQFVSVNPLALAFMSLGGHYEFNLNKSAAIGINASVLFWGTPEWSTFGLGVGGEYNFYFQDHAPNGWFAGPGAGLQLLSATYSSESATTIGFNINGHGGYRWIWDNGFLVDVVGTLGFTIMSLTINNVSLPYGGGFGLGIGASIGYAWK